MGIRYYFAEQDDGIPEIVIVGVGKDEKDLANGMMLELSIPCPPRC